MRWTIWLSRVLPVPLVLPALLVLLDLLVPPQPSPTPAMFNLRLVLDVIAMLPKNIRGPIISCIRMV